MMTFKNVNFFLFSLFMLPLSMWGQNSYPTTGNASVNGIGIGLDAPSYGVNMNLITGGGWARQLLVKNTINGLVGKGYFGVFGSDAQASYAYIGLQSNATPLSTINEWTYANNIKFYTTGNMSIPGSLGIGTATPGVKLDVSGIAWFNRPATKIDNLAGIELGYNVSFNYPSFGAGAANYANFRWVDASTFRLGVDYDGHAGLGGTLANLQFGATNTPYMHIQNNGATAGNVGIGTTTPKAKLEISDALNQYPVIVGGTQSGTTTGNGVFLAVNNTSPVVNNRAGIGFTDATGQAAGSAWMSAIFKDRTNHYGDLSFTTRGTSGAVERMYITSDGNVGIGTNTPQAKLDMGNTDGNAIKAVLARQAEGNTTSTGTALLVKAYGTQQTIFDGKMFSLENHFYGVVNSSINFYRGGDTRGGFLTFNTNTNIEKMRLDAQGNLGVGTTTPSAKVDIIQDNPAVAGVRVSSAVTSPATPQTVVKMQTIAASNLTYLGAESNSDLGLITNNGPKIYIKANGDVGIGTTTPQAKLDISGNVSSTELSTNKISLKTGSLKLEGGGNVSPFSAFMRWGDNTGWKMIFGSRTQTVGGVENTGTTGAVMTLVDVGNVGIGTTTPENKLHVKGTVQIGGNYQTEASVNISPSGVNNGAGIYAVNAGQYQPLTVDSKSFTIRGSGGTTNTFIMNEVGNVGMGTTTPVSALHLTKSLNIDNYLTISADHGSDNRELGGVVFRRGNYNPNENAAGMFFYRTSSGAEGGLRFKTQYGAGSLKTALDIDPNGNVLIGTTAVPSGYKFAVEGNVVAEKVVVKFKANWWPDYVFKPDYKLPPLSIVEQNIKEQGHLTDVPSEKEVAEKGIDLGDMNAKLLKKIEELTLYIIEQDKRLQKLEEQAKKK